MRNVLAALFAAAVLSACGGGGESAPAPAAPAPLPVVILYGDSVQRGDAAGTNTAEQAQHSLAGVATLRQEGVNGSMAYQLVQGADGRHVRWDRELDGSPSRVVSFNYGINDWSYSLTEYHDALYTLTRMAQETGRVVILQTPNPLPNAPAAYGDVTERVAVMREVARERGAVLCDHYADAMARGLEGQTLDGVHPNATQYDAMGNLFAGCVREALSRK